jgi:hypothetical protein
MGTDVAALSYLDFRAALEPVIIGTASGALLNFAAGSAKRLKLWLLCMPLLYIPYLFDK